MLMLMLVILRRVLKKLTPVLLNKTNIQNKAKNPVGSRYLLTGFRKLTNERLFVFEITIAKYVSTEFIVNGIIRKANNSYYII